MSKTALVTGASRGIGRATVERMLKNVPSIGTIVMMARPSEDFSSTQKLFEEINEAGKTLIALETDVGDRDSLRIGIRSAYERAGNIDYLINNAGYTNPVPIHQVEFEDFERTMA